MSRSYRWSSLLVPVAFGLLLAGCYSPTLPLPPPARENITVSPPDDEGFVEVDGAPGTLEPGEQVVIVNTETHYGWIVPGDDDGGFHAIVMAEAGQWLSIQRRLGDELGRAIEVEVPAP